ncbi:mRNA splicing protein SMD1 [Saccharomyces eubayanus]|uniref:mRNA splicing protein SMD1 n=1 Tax=Saccharomyces eubayanus TaxID=1080349 RepID=UPI0006C3F15A|nr:SMD1-like protein [Saccharomyces eubayanus]KOG99566.1 SMD1-like protein [Saccharomyces eubayanus]
MKLVNFLKKLRNEQVTIELKNGTTVWGTLQSVSPQMNAILTDVKLTLPQPRLNKLNSNGIAMSSLYLSGGQQATTATTGDNIASLQYINIRGNTIRQIILPDSLNLDSLLVDQMQLNTLRRSGQVASDPNKKRRRDFSAPVNKRPRRGL